MNDPGGQIGLYVHWPFCSRICPYCDFNIYRDRGVEQSAWIRVFTEELRFWRAHTGKRPLASIYFGGGTPSLMPVPVLEAVLGEAEALFGFVPGAEITLEANPTDAETDRLRQFRQAGVNRLSLGIQSLRDQHLEFLGRNHDANEARRAIAEVLGLFDRSTFDLIYALPGQSLADWERDLTEALALGLPHLSVYQLTVEPETAFERAVARGSWAPKNADEEAAFYDLTQEITAEHGLPAYEISNHAKPGHEAVHNRLYWTGADYIGIGPGAHGRIGIDGLRHATKAAEKPADWLAGTKTISVEPLSQEEQATEYLSMGLRLKKGILLARFHTLAERTLPEERIAELVESGLLETENGWLRLTPAGRPLLNRIVLELIA